MDRQAPDESGEFEMAPAEPCPPSRLTHGQAVVFGVGVIVAGLLLARWLSPTPPPAPRAP